MSDEQIKTTEINENDIKSIAPAVQQIIYSDLGRYANVNTGLDSYYYLVNVIDNISTHLIINYGKEWFETIVNSEMQKSKDIIKFENWKDFSHYLKKISPVINKIKLQYDNFRSMKKDEAQKLSISKVNKRLCPYQIDIFFMLNLMLKLSGEQRRTIPKEYFKSPEANKFSTERFDRKPPEVRDGSRI